MASRKSATRCCNQPTNPSPEVKQRSQEEVSTVKINRHSNKKKRKKKSCRTSKHLIAGLGILLLLGLKVRAEVVVADEGEVLWPLPGDDGVGVLVEAEPEPVPVHEGRRPAPEAAGPAPPGTALGLGPFEHGAALQDPGGGSCIYNETGGSSLCEYCQ